MISNLELQGSHVQAYILILPNNRAHDRLKTRSGKGNKINEKQGEIDEGSDLAYGQREGSTWIGDRVVHKRK